MIILGYSPRKTRPLLTQIIAHQEFTLKLVPFVDQTNGTSLGANRYWDWTYEHRLAHVGQLVVLPSVAPEEARGPPRRNSLPDREMRGGCLRINRGSKLSSHHLPDMSHTGFSCSSGLILGVSS
jgi:hypothetical protein